MTCELFEDANMSGVLCNLDLQQLSQLSLYIRVFHDTVCRHTPLDYLGICDMQCKRSFYCCWLLA